MSRRIPIELDGTTARLLSLARGVQAGELLPDASARTLVQSARCVRLLVEAWEYGIAGAVLDDLDKLAATAGPDELAVAQRIGVRVDAVRKALP